MSWTDERIALLKKMWKEGKSAAEIAKTLGKGVTRNAVIGKAHRMGLSGRPSPIKKQAAPKKEKEAAPKKTAKAPAARKADPAPASGGRSAPPAREVEEPRKPDREIAPLNGGVSLLELTERMCKWPIGDPREPDFVFCGRGIRQGTPYCPDHASMAYQSSSRSRNQVAANDKEDEVEEADVEVDEDAADDDEADAAEATTA